MTPLEMIAEGQRLIAEGVAMLASPPDLRVTCPRVECSPLAQAPDVCQNASDAPLLVDVTEAARMMGITVSAFRTRLNRGQVPGVVRTGRKVQVHRERFLAGLTKTKAGRAA